ncbi:MAG TPA: DUF6365 family protein [Streptomyces sp.]|uniref:DUF6365 family protein n=1 Tax=Streptomyces sp. TaxID=1931 RepID=UPI002D6BA035|nr:DUF6365 family protein [Streptomyces sp.]HZG05467.1 DUF6365 family protein [Streptomyces sp.]
MRLLVMAMLAKTLHETAIGLDLVEQLRGAGVSAHFVVDVYSERQLAATDHPYTVVESSMGEGVRKVVGEAVREFRPDAIVLSDYVAHWMMCSVNYGIDPWFIDEFALPVVPIDTVSLADTDLMVEISGRRMRVSDRILTAPAHLLPVPGNRPRTGAGGRGLPYRADRAVRPLPSRARREIRRSLGVGDGERLLMVPLLPWQRTMQDLAGPTVRELARRVPELVGHYLRRLPDGTRFVVAGPYLDGLGLPPDRTRVETSYSTRRYTDLLAASDAVLALFLPSFALERAILADVPGLFTVNTFEIGGEPGVRRAAEALGGLSPAVRSWLERFPGTVPPFHMWPLQWNGVVGRLLEDNPFTTTALRAELFDEESVVGGLESVLYDPAVRDRLAAARAAYRDALDRLPDTAEVFATAARRAGAAV